MDDDNNLMDLNVTDLDLNQELINPPVHSVLGSLLNELETSSVIIDQRFQHLEAINARAMQGQRWRQAQNSIEIRHSPNETTGLIGNGVSLHGNSNIEISERTVERGNGCKRDSSHLVAKASEMDSHEKKADKEGGSFFDCNICLEIANDPVLTVCGHLFCWACFYQVSYIDSTNKECPVCKGEVSDNTVTPIYGNRDGAHIYESESGLRIPPRPRASRIESIRQQCVTGDFSQVYVAAALRSIRNYLAMDDTESGREGQNEEDVGEPRVRIRQVSRILSESAASLSSLTSALGDAERLIVDLEPAINGHFSRIGERTVSVDGGDPSLTQSNDQSQDLLVDDHDMSSTDVSGSVSRLLRMRASTQQRRSNMARIMDFHNRDAREARRRRLN